MCEQRTAARSSEALGRRDIPDILERMAKVLVSLDDALLRRIDRAARSRGLSRSAYLAELAHRDLLLLSAPGRSAAARHSLARLDALFASAPAGDSTAAVRVERDAR